MEETKILRSFVLHQISRWREDEDVLHGTTARRAGGDRWTSAGTAFSVGFPRIRPATPGTFQVPSPTTTRIGGGEFAAGKKARIAQRRPKSRLFLCPIQRERTRRKREPPFDPLNCWRLRIDGTRSGSSSSHTTHKHKKIYPKDTPFVLRY